jgi:hypothetical protein
MRSRIACCVAFVVLAMIPVLLNASLATPGFAAETEKMLAHDVYFSLNDNSAESKEKLVAACKKYLSGHPGTTWFAAGRLADEVKGGRNDLEFEVALHLVFQNKAALDRYSKAERHLKFIDENKANWKQVRVFDSYIEVSSHEGVEGKTSKPK